MKQHTILIRIQLIVLTFLYGMTVQAQTIEKYGTFFNDAIPVVLSGNRSIFTDKRINLYDETVAEYRQTVSRGFGRQDFIEYNEILFSAHSCAIEGNIIITTSVIFPFKEMNIAIHKERLFIISSTCLYREILSSITGKQTIRQDRVIPLFMS